MHPVWLIALGTLGAFLTYLAAEIWRDGDPLDSVLFAVAGVAVLTAVALDAVGVIA